MIRATFALLLCLVMAHAGAQDNAQPSAQELPSIDVQVDGVGGEPRENIFLMLSIYQYRNDPDITPASVERLHLRAPNEIRRAMMPYGYYEPEIVQDELTRDGNQWTARYVVEPGEPVRVTSWQADIDGSELLAGRLSEIITNPPLKKGDRLVHSVYESFKSLLLRRAFAAGYLDARFSEQRLLVDRERHAADIRLVLTAGPRYQFGETNIEQPVLDDDVIRRYLNYEPGDPFDYDKLLALQYKLMDSEYFTNVRVRAKTDQAGEDHVVPVDVTADRNKRYRYTAGVGYGTDTGPRLTAGWRNRFVNRRGHKAGVEFLISEIERTLSAAYTIPLKKPAQDKFVLNTSWQDQQFGDERSQKFSLGGNLVRSLGEWQRTLYLRYERERDETTLPDIRTELVLPGVTYLRTSSDDLLYPTHGHKLFYELRGASEALGSDAGFLQARVQTKRIYSFLDSWRLLLRAEVGSTWIDETLELPASQRFFAGGDQSVRGFDYQQLGPVNADGNVVGGKHLAVASAEVEVMFTENWGMAVFTDAGNAMDDWSTPLEQSYGLGLRWRSPLGMFRFDLARPVDRQYEPPNGVEIHISIGPDL